LGGGRFLSASQFSFRKLAPLLGSFRPPLGLASFLPTRSAECEDACQA
jgi:hypothetical protein